MPIGRKDQPSYTPTTQSEFTADSHGRGSSVTRRPSVDRLLPDAPSLADDDSSPALSKVSAIANNTSETIKKKENKIDKKIYRLDDLRMSLQNITGALVNFGAAAGSLGLITLIVLTITFFAGPVLPLEPIMFVLLYILPPGLGSLLLAGIGCFVIQVIDEESAALKIAQRRLLIVNSDVYVKELFNDVYEEKILKDKKEIDVSNTIRAINELDGIQYFREFLEKEDREYFVNVIENILNAFFQEIKKGLDENEHKNLSKIKLNYLNNLLANHGKQARQRFDRLLSYNRKNAVVTDHLLRLIKEGITNCINKEEASATDVRC